MDRKVLTASNTRQPKSDKGEMRRASSKQEFPSPKQPARNKNVQRQLKMPANQGDSRPNHDPFHDEEYRDLDDFNPIHERTKTGRSPALDSAADVSDLDIYLIEMAHSQKPSKAKGHRAKFTSINHLLQFNMTPAEVYAPPPKRYTPKPKPFDKEQFVQANFQFFVHPARNYIENIVDPDALVQWDDILYVKYGTPDSINCSICISFPVAAQMTKCGHIFCASCIRQYFSYGPKYPRCPLCFVGVEIQSMKPVVIENMTKFSDGQSIKFSLLKRSKGSITPMRKLEWDPIIQDQLLSDENDESKFGRLCLGTKFMDVLVHQEHDVDDAISLADALPEEHDGVMEFLEAAKERLAIMKESAMSIAIMDYKSTQTKRSNIYKVTNTKVLSSSPIVAPSEPLPQPVGLSPWSAAASLSNPNQYEEQRTHHTGDEENTQVDDQVPDEWFSRGVENEETFVDNTGTETNSAVDNAPIVAHEDEKQSDSPKPSPQLQSQGQSHYMIYQSDDGQRIFLHPFCMKVLKHEFGDAENFPTEIVSTIKQMELVTMTEDARRRYRFLGHLPLTTEFQFCEVDMSKIVSQATLRRFSSELNQRRAKYNSTNSNSTVTAPHKETQPSSVITNRGSQGSTPSASPIVTGQQQQQQQQRVAGLDIEYRLVESAVATSSIDTVKNASSSPSSMSISASFASSLSPQSSNAPIIALMTEQQQQQQQQQPIILPSSSLSSTPPSSSIPTSSRPSFADALLQNPHEVQLRRQQQQQQSQSSSSSSKSSNGKQKKGKAVLFSTSANHRY